MITLSRTSSFEYISMANADVLFELSLRVVHTSMYEFLFLLLFSRAFFINAHNPCATKYYGAYEVINSRCAYSMLYRPNMFNLEPEIPPGLIDPSISIFTYINSSFIPTIRKDTFVGVSHIITLSITDSSISEIEANAFDNFSSLIILRLPNNNITDLKEGVFSTLNALEELVLSNNSIHTINSYDGLEKLHVLNLSYNKIQNIKALEVLTKLKTLDLSGNSIADVCNLKLSQLERLYLSGNVLQTVRTNCFGYMEYLLVLDISNNAITSISTGAFSGLHSIKTINLSRNHISSFEGYPFHNTPEIAYLDVSGNVLTKLDVDGLKYAKKLFLHGNKFKCSTLVGIMNALKPTNVELDYKASFQEFNIRGISCEDDLILHPTANTENSKSYVNCSNFECLNIADIKTNLERIGNALRKILPIMETKHSTSSDFINSPNETNHTENVNVNNYANENDNLHELAKKILTTGIIIWIVIMLVAFITICILYKWNEATQKIIKQKYELSPNCELELII